MPSRSKVEALRSFASKVWCLRRMLKFRHQRRIASESLADTDVGLCNSVAIYLCAAALLIP